MTAAAARSRTYRALAEAFRSGASDSAAAAELVLPPSSDNPSADFLAVFDPALSDTACSLHGGAYARQDRSALFEELVRFYRFFGLVRDADAELPDHVAVELEFLHYLTFLEHETKIRGDGVDGLRKAERDFIIRHLLPLAQGIGGSCRSDSPRLLGLVRSLNDFLIEERDRLSV